VAARVQKLFAITTIHLRDVLLMAVGTIALAWYAATGTASAGVAACAVLAAITLHCCASAMKWSSLTLLTGKQA
jgi:hypothetical protein